MMRLSSLIAFVVFKCTVGQMVIQPDDLYSGILNNSFDAVLDIRRIDEWEAGHIVNATFVENLQTQTALPDILRNCKGQCETIVVYCRSGNRARGGIAFLLSQGFEGTIYNGLGTSQWVEAGYTLVDTDSVDPPCYVEEPACSDEPSTTPSTSASPTMSSQPTMSNQPSGGPTTSSQPSTSSEPTFSFVPSQAPSMSLVPSKIPSEQAEDTIGALRYGGGRYDGSLGARAQNSSSTYVSSWLAVISVSFASFALFMN